MRSCWALVEHRDAGRDLVVAIKYRRHLDAVELLGQAMASLVVEPVGIVTWAPTTRDRRRRRGFDQAELLARSVAAAMGIECHRLLERRSGKNQTGRTRDERLTGPVFDLALGAATRLTRICTDAEQSVLVVDDVRTTGATLCAAAETLLTAQVAIVDGLTLSVRV